MCSLLRLCVLLMIRFSLFIFRHFFGWCGSIRFFCTYISIVFRLDRANKKRYFSQLAPQIETEKKQQWYWLYIAARCTLNSNIGIFIDTLCIYRYNGIGLSHHSTVPCPYVSTKKTFFFLFLLYVLSSLLETAWSIHHHTKSIRAILALMIIVILLPL